jgi:hypothetical protein
MFDNRGAELASTGESPVDANGAAMGQAPSRWARQVDSELTALEATWDELFAAGVDPADPVAADLVVDTWVEAEDQLSDLIRYGVAVDEMPAGHSGWIAAHARPLEGVPGSAPADLSGMTPGAHLAGVLEAEEFDQLTTGRLADSLAAWEKLIAWAQAQQAAAAAELTRRPEMQASNAEGRSSLHPVMVTAGDVCTVWPWTKPQAQRLVGWSVQLVESFPAVHHALAEGRLDSRRARILTDALADHDPQVARLVEAAVLPYVHRWTSVKVSYVVKRLLAEIAPETAKERHRNARKKRDIVEKHLNKYNMTHVTRKRDVLGGVAVSGTIGVVTLGVGTLGADAIAAQGAEHGIAAIVENDLAIKVVTHAALDGAGLAVEHAHTNHLKKKEAHKAFEAAGTFQAVADAKAVEAGYAAPGYGYQDTQYNSYAASSSSQLYYPPPPPPYTPGPLPSSDPNQQAYSVPSYTDPAASNPALQPQPAQQYNFADSGPKSAAAIASLSHTPYQQAPYAPPANPVQYAAVVTPPASSGQEYAPTMFDMKGMADALPTPSPAPSNQRGITGGTEQTGVVSQDFSWSPTPGHQKPQAPFTPDTTCTSIHTRAASISEYQPSVTGSFVSTPSLPPATHTYQSPTPNPVSPSGPHELYQADRRGSEEQWTVQNQEPVQVTYNAPQMVQPVPVQPVPVQPAAIPPVEAQPIVVQPFPVQPATTQPVMIQPVEVQPVPVHPVTIQSPPVQPVPVHPAVVQPVPIQPVTTYGQIPPTPPVSTPGATWGQQTDTSSYQSLPYTPQYVHSNTPSLQYYSPPVAQPFLPSPAVPQPTPIPNSQYYQPPSEPRYETVAIPQAYNASRPKPQIYYPPTPQSLPMSPSGPLQPGMNNGACYFPPPPTGY